MQFCEGDVVSMKGEIGQKFVAKINGSYAEILINLETKCGVITKVIPGPECGTEFSYMIKYMCFQFPIEVDEDYILFKGCC